MAYFATLDLYMRHEPSSVSIQDPTIKTLHKRKSCLHRSCVSGLGFITFFIIILIIGVRVIIGPGARDLNGLPGNFPESIVLYDQDNIQKVRFVSGKSKQRGFEVAALIPKIIMAPIFATLNPERDLKKSIESGHVVYRKDVQWSDFASLIATPITKDMDTVAIEWSNLGADMTFIEDFYTNELRKAGFSYELQPSKADSSLVTFHKGDISGSLYLEDHDVDLRGTDYATLTVDIPPK